MSHVLSSGVASAACTGDYHCGHITRSSSRAVKRAAFLYLAEAQGCGWLGRRTEAPEVLAAVVLMRAGAACASVIAAATGDEPAVAEMALALVPATPLSVQVLGVMVLVCEGWSYPEIADEQGIATETVRSHVKRAMRSTGAHTALDAAVLLTEQGLI